MYEQRPVSSFLHVSTLTPYLTCSQSVTASQNSPSTRRAPGRHRISTVTMTPSVSLENGSSTRSHNPQTPNDPRTALPPGLRELDRPMLFSKLYRLLPLLSALDSPRLNPYRLEGQTYALWQLQTPGKTWSYRTLPSSRSSSRT